MSSSLDKNGLEAADGKLQQHGRRSIAQRTSELVFAVDVEGMMCQKNCGSTVQRALEALPGVDHVEVSFPAGRAWVWMSTHASGTIPSTASVIKAVEDVGFGAALAPDVELAVEGMMCQKNCGTTVKNALEAVPGVASVESSFAEGRARAWLEERDVGGGKGRDARESVGDASIETRLVDALECVGFGASVAPVAVLEIDGMMCQKNCGTTVKNALERVRGVTRAHVSFAEKRARIWGRMLLLPVSILVGAVEAVGFGAKFVRDGEGAVDATTTATPRDASVDGKASAEEIAQAKQELIEAEMAAFQSSRAMPGSAGEEGFVDEAVSVFSVSGMSCASCVGNVERLVMAMQGVLEVRVALLAEKAEVRYDPSSTDGKALADAITSLGYAARHLNTALLSSDGLGSGAAGGKDASRGGGGAISLEVWGITGPACVAKVESRVLKLPGVLSCSLTRLSGHAAVYTSTVASSSSSSPLPLAPSSSSANVTGGRPGGQDRGTYTSVYRLVAVLSVPAPLLAVNASNVDAGRYERDTGRYFDDGVRQSHRVEEEARASSVSERENDDSIYSTAENGHRYLAAAAAAGGDWLSSSSKIAANGMGRATIGERPGPQGQWPKPEAVAGNDAVWTAITAAYHPDGTRKTAGVREVVEAVQGLGYGARLEGHDGADANSMETSQAKEVAQWRRLLALALAFTLPVMFLHATADTGFLSQAFLGTGVSCSMILSWVLVTGAQVVVGKRFYLNAYKAARHGSYGMDMLVVVGTSVSYLYSTLSLLLACFPGNARHGNSHPHLFLESPAMLLTFISLGKFLEVMAKRKTSQALVLLLRAQPHKAVLVEPGDVSAAFPTSENRLEMDVTSGWRERSIEAALVQPGDVLKVVPGAQFPTDGTVLSGRTYVDESMITGESLPAAKHVGDHVCGGTVNQHGSVLMRAERVGEDTMLAQLCRLVEEAQMSKAPIQRQADKVAGVFVPFVMCTSLVTFLVWFVAAEVGVVPQSWLAEERSDAFLFALLFGVSVVVVACPCSVGLATPTAVMVGTGVGASNGVLIKGGAALEAAHRVTTVVFDKTGTLTMGKPFLTDVVPIPSSSLDELVASTTGSANAGAVANGGVVGGVGSAPPYEKTQNVGNASGPAVKAAVLAIAATCEAWSEHPIGRAMVDAHHAAAAASSAGIATAPLDATTCESAHQSSSQNQSSASTFAVDANCSESAQSRMPNSGQVSDKDARGSGSVVSVCAAVVSEFESEPGRGVACQHRSLGRVCVGTRAWAESNGGKRKYVAGASAASALASADVIMRRLENDGKTAVIVSVEGAAVGVIAVADTDKEGSRRTVLALGNMGLDVWIVTGDNRRVAAALARRLGVAPDRVLSEVLPAEKARKVQELQVDGGFVAMVGDGVNDAPALATADVGIAVGAGTQVAMEAADMVLVRSDVCDVVAALHLSKKVFGRIRLNFVFAMLYNLCGVPIAAGALYPVLHIRLPPALAGLSMALSSISVVLASLALRLYTKPKIDENGRLSEQGLWTTVWGLLKGGGDGLHGFVARHARRRRFSPVAGDESDDASSGGSLGAGNDRQLADWTSSMARSLVSKTRNIFRGIGKADIAVGPYALVLSDSEHSARLHGSGDVSLGGAWKDPSVGGRKEGLEAARGGIDEEFEFNDDGDVELLGRFV